MLVINSDISNTIPLDFGEQMQCSLTANLGILKLYFKMQPLHTRHSRQQGVSLFLPPFLQLSSLCSCGSSGEELETAFGGFPSNMSRPFAMLQKNGCRIECNLFKLCGLIGASFRVESYLGLYAKVKPVQTDQK